MLKRSVYLILGAYKVSYILNKLLKVRDTENYLIFTTEEVLKLL